ncbi:MAG: hypothetical protein H0U25_13925 [Thermoleophilaceae bacterium]|nr:hypothetical protein [Thermoleophilaceae bacterium]
MTDKTKMIANGVEARVIRDTVSEKGVPVEVTDDWFAQDNAGNIWYLGEYGDQLRERQGRGPRGLVRGGGGRRPSRCGDATNPEPGMSYRQEYLKGEAEDEGAVITVGQEQVQVPFGFFDKDLLMTRDLVPLEPKVPETEVLRPGPGSAAQRAHRRRGWTSGPDVLH